MLKKTKKIIDATIRNLPAITTGLAVVSEFLGRLEKLERAKPKRLNRK